MTSTAGIVLGPIGALYGIATRARLALYRSGKLRVHRLGAPTISVGNITTGGTGKTPLVARLARLLAAERLRPCILTRGYGRIDEKRRVLVSDGERVLASVSEGGDEPRLLAERLLGTASIISDADRVAAARWALDHLRPDVFILDDGFQHLRVARDFNILTIDATNPWGGKRLLPLGRLREPLSEIRRADCCIITRAEQADRIDSLCEEVRERSGGRPLFLSRTRIVGLRSLMATQDDEPLESSNASLLSLSDVPQRVAAFCALGNPQAFFTQLRNAGLTLTYTRAFTDHHAYTHSDVEQIERAAQSSGAQVLLTTAKDGVKLRAFEFQLPCYVVEIDLEMDDELVFKNLLLQAVKAANAAERRPMAESSE